MIRTLRAGLAFAAALALAAPSAATLAAPAKPAAKAPAKPVPGPKRAFGLAPGQWPQAKSDVKADPDVLFGALPNGMRYAIRKQSIPPGQASLRLWIGAGALEETDDQQGLAHFLEHMAFNGSKRIKEGEMIKIMERLGLKFGPDTNAFTSFDQTVYMFDLPKTDAESLDTALMVMRETAGELTLAPDAVDRERGVVLSEERQSASPQLRFGKAQLDFMMPGQRVPTRYPIVGSVDVLKTAPASRLQDFYRRYYRPERAVLVVVGDFDPAAIEAKVRARFSDWQGVGPAGGDFDLGRVQPRGTQAKVLVEPGMPLVMATFWVRPPDLTPDTLAERRKDLVRQLGFSVLNRRFSALARTANAPFIAAAGGAGNQLKSVEFTQVRVNARPEQWSAALAAADQEQRRIVQYGVRQEELDLEIEDLRTRLKAAAAGAATRRQADLANEIIGSLPEDEVVTSPSQELAMFERDVKGLTAAEVSAVVKQSFQGQGPLVFISSPKAIEGGEPAVLAQLAASQKVAVAAPAAQAKVAWPYESFGPAGKVAERREAADIGTTFVRFENGVRLTVKPTKFRNDEVLVRVNLGDGLLSLAKDQGSLEILQGAFIEGGLKKIGNEDMERVLASKTYDADFDYGEDAFTLSGRTRTGDLGTQMQVLAGFVSDAGWRPEAFQRYKSFRGTYHDQLEATDQGVLGRELPALLHAGDRRWVVASRSEIAKANLDDLKAQIAPHLANEPIEVVMVGDLTVDQAVAAVAATFGALPPRAAPKPVPDSQRQVTFPAGVAQPVTFTHKGRADQAMAFIAWPTTDIWSNPQQARELTMLGEVLQNRLIEELREAQGSAYAPSAAVNQSTVFPGWGYVGAVVEMPPAKMPEFFTDVQKIAADLRSKEIDADELARAKKPRLEQIQRIRVTNGYWLGALSNAQRDPRRLELIRDQVAGAEKVTAADIKRVAGFLKDDKAVKIVVKPAGG